MESFIFKYLSKKDITAMLTAFNACTGLHTQLIDDRGKIIVSVGENAAFCKEFIRHLPAQESCETEHANASRQAMDLGESYLFCCHAGLYHIVFPIISKDTMFGSVVTGPFLMEEPDASLIIDVERRYHLSTETLLNLSEDSYHLKVISPELANQYSKLLYYLMNNLNQGSREVLLSKQGKLLQQSRISESIQMYKNSGFRNENLYPLDQENLLISKIKTGDLEEARKILNELLGALILYENHDLERLKIRIIELCTLLSRAAIDRGSETNMVLHMTDRLIASIINSDDIYDICYTFQDNMEIFTESLFYSSDKNNKVIKRAAEYITNHFSEPVTLADVAENIHLNASYLSTLFKQVTGFSFKEYLNNIRIEEAQRLLANTDYPIMEIAIACGFSDQSYFTKVFKKHTGLTPKQYR